MLRRSQVSLLRTHSPTTFTEGTGIQKIPTNPITRIQTKVSPWYKSTTVHQVWDPWRIDRGIVMILLHSQFHYSFPPLHFTYLWIPFLFILFLSDYSYAFFCAALLTDVLTDVQFCLLICLLICLLCLLIHSSCTVYKDRVDTTIQ